ncbi:MAG TPA: VWA domain-containing protein [Blastocatellia bacterium]|nr:VWA domain-containing protein [Blastocatellia bacterium]
MMKRNPLATIGFIIPLFVMSTGFSTSTGQKSKDSHKGSSVPSGQNNQKSGDDAIKLESDLVTVDATVMDGKGNYVRDLKEEDFTVTEDGVPQQLAFFESTQHSGLTRPLAAVFDLDVSGSIQPQEIKKQRDAAESFLKLVRPESEFAVMTFNYRIRVVQNFTNDPHKFLAAFGKIEDPGGSTRIFASIDQAIQMLKRGPQSKNGRLLRRVVVVITDGYDSVDSIEQDDMIRRANQAGVTVYSITLPSYLPGLGAKHRALTLLDASGVVKMTGGADFSADSEDFTPAFNALAEEISSSYTLAFYPPNKDKHDGKVHQIKVQVKRPGVQVKVDRQNYVAQR